MVFAIFLASEKEYEATYTLKQHLYDIENVVSSIHRDTDIRKNMASES